MSIRKLFLVIVYMRVQMEKHYCKSCLFSILKDLYITSKFIKYISTLISTGRRGSCKLLKGGNKQPFKIAIKNYVGMYVPLSKLKGLQDTSKIEILGNEVVIFKIYLLLRYLYDYSPAGQNSYHTPITHPSKNHFYTSHCNNTNCNQQSTLKSAAKCIVVL